MDNESNGKTQRLGKSLSELLPDSNENHLDSNWRMGKYLLSGAKGLIFKVNFGKNNTREEIINLLKEKHNNKFFSEDHFYKIFDSLVQGVKYKNKTLLKLKKIRKTDPKRYKLFSDYLQEVKFQS